RHTRFSRDWSSDVCSSDLNEMLCGSMGGGGLSDCSTVIERHCAGDCRFIRGGFAQHVGCTHIHCITARMFSWNTWSAGCSSLICAGLCRKVQILLQWFAVIVAFCCPGCQPSIDIGTRWLMCCINTLRLRA